VVSRALQEGANTFVNSHEAQQAAQAVQDAAKHFQETTQSMLSTPQAQKVATSIESAANSVKDGTTSFLQSGQVLPRRIQRLQSCMSSRAEAKQWTLERSAHEYYLWLGRV
jgi:hypothetical protein